MATRPRYKCVATDVVCAFDGDAAGKSKAASRKAGGPAVGSRVPGRSDFGTWWDRGLLPPGLVALPRQLRHQLL